MTLIKTKRFEYSVFCFALGFIVMIGEFAVFCYPAIFMDIPFHIICYLAITVYIIECLAILIWLIIGKRFNLNNFLNKDRIFSWLKCPAFWAMVILCGLQILRLVVFQTSQIRDSKSYNALVLDILQSDQLFKTNPDNGMPITSILDMELKYSLSPWYPFISMLAWCSKLHPLIILNTILPGYLLLLHYMIIFALGYLLLENGQATCCFVALYSFIQEISLFCHTPTMIKLVWPVWGKGVLSMTVIPAVLILYMFYVDDNSQIREIGFLWIFLLIVIAGCSMSTMAAMVLPIELGILGLVWTIRNHSARPLVYSIITCLLPVLYIGAYYYLSHLQGLR